MALITYIPPVGEECQNIVTDECVHVHSDVYLLFNLQNLAIADRIADSVISRCNKSIDMSQDPPTLNDTLNKVSPDDFPADTLHDYSVYNQSLSSRKSRIESKMRQIDELIDKIKDSPKTAEAKRYRKALENFYKSNLSAYVD